jgi:hypothetical protein
MKANKFNRKKTTENDINIQLSSLSAKVFDQFVPTTACQTLLFNEYIIRELIIFIKHYIM